MAFPVFFVAPGRDGAGSGKFRHCARDMLESSRRIRRSVAETVRAGEGALGTFEAIIYGFELLGTVIFAITGAVRGVRLRLDLLGVVVFACTVGVGGGILRDMMIGATPVAALRDETYLAVCIVTGLTIFFLSPLVSNVKRLIPFCDALGLGVFTALGATKGMAYELGVVGVVLSGVLTAVGGGVIRDIMAMKIPVVLTSDFYATAALIGGVLYVYLSPTRLPEFYTFIIVVCVVTGIRLLAMHFKFRLPAAGRGMFPRRRARRSAD